ncbi:MAG TPA: proline dehydrogenase family protein [Saprospiraceae bacterium]|nr:proline dehydrogenase family protein [Saprospiraceae bacterium]
MAGSETDYKPHHKTVDFTNTEIAFAQKSNKELRRLSYLFRLMNKPWIVNTGSSLGLWMHEKGINIFNPMLKATIFKQFCGGTSLEDSQESIDHLHANRTLTVLDYGAEGKSTEADFDRTLLENIKAISFASTHPSVPIISSKISSLASATLLQKFQEKGNLNEQESIEFEKVRSRVNQLCHAAKRNSMSIFFDAEETWIQDAIDKLVKDLMEKFNREKVVVYHTYQLYRKGKLQSLIEDHKEAVTKGYKLGAKLVRGAYMEKERERAKTMGYPSPIQDTKEDTDRDYNLAVKYCVEHYEQIASCNGSHNLQSVQYEAGLIADNGLQRNHSHLNFCQLYGMSDYITFNLAAAGYNVAKYVPYGPVKEVIPYLIRRAKENTSVTGEMSRELSLILAEMKRRGMK